MTGTGADQYAADWFRVYTGPHREHGGWLPGQGEPVCLCGAVIREAEGVKT